MLLETRIKAALTAIGTDIKALFARAVPAGGATGQVLAKTGPGDYEIGWQSAAAGGGPSASVIRVEVDFGPSGSSSGTFDVAIPGLAPDTPLVASASLDMPSGVSADELELDPITVAAHAISADTARLAVGAQSRLRGKRAINIMRA